MKQPTNIVLVGAGHAHVEVIRRLGAQRPANVNVTLVSETTRAGYSGMMPGVIAGHYLRSQAEIDVPALCKKFNVQFIHDGVQGVRAAANRLECAQATLPYDWLSLNTGSQPHTPELAFAHHVRVKPFAQFLDGLPTLLKRPHIAIVGGGAASVEVLLALAHVRRGFGRLSLLCGAADILAGYPSSVVARAREAILATGVSLHLNSMVNACVDSGLTLSDGSYFSCDASVWCTRAGPSAFIAHSDLQTANDGFIAVDAFQRSVSHANVFAVGDCASRAPSLPKAGVVPVKQGPWLADTLLAISKGIEPTAPFTFQKHALALLALGDQRAIGFRGNLIFSGRWAWHWKDVIDRRFMRKYN